LALILQDPPEDGLLYLIPVLMTSLFGGGMWVAGRGRFRTGRYRQPDHGRHPVCPGARLFS
jgi:hypothetical protein